MTTEGTAAGGGRADGEHPRRPRRPSRPRPTGSGRARRAGSAVGRGLSRSAGRVRSAARADGADRSGLSSLLTVHALHAAGDALVAVALAGTLFFTVPLGEARSRVALYLILTMLPFSLLIPVAGPLLDRFPHGRRTVLAVTTGGRGLITWVMAGALTGFGLYPLALGVLVLSRAYGVARAAAVPRVRPPALGLVSANARLNIAAVSSGLVAAGIGTAIVRATGSSEVALYLASVLLITGGVLALRLPEHVDEARDREPDVPSAVRFRLNRLSPLVTGPLAAALSLRALAGLLTIFLAFLLRAEGATAPLVAAVVVAAAAGQLGGTAAAARLPESADKALAVLALALPFATCLLAALTGDELWMVAAAGATGVSVSLSRFGLDAAVQKHVPPRAISTAFARSETGLQMSWVIGGGLALAVPTVASAGFGVAAALPVLGVLGARQLALRGRAGHAP
ncbi:MAG TPA: MFS transporter [Mycobacteriales bacterium]|nr:MFS transporter [Mycobacteriales bacterium]